MLVQQKLHVICQAVKYEPLPLSSPNPETQRGLFLWPTMPTDTSRYLVPQALLLESRYDLQKTRDIY
jgi:hypothetical protein